MRQESKEAKLVTKDTIDFGKVTSSRLRLGSRSSFKLLRFIMSFTGEFGIKIEFGNFRMELSGESYVGKREGLVGLLRLAYLL
ncbi:MAG: hypothetical protein LBD98_02080 [Endomicrobium sp.]|nr:hypothetical protein [Endomicrobium sp.]